MQFQGLSAFPITPADPQGHVDTAALRRLLRRLADAEVDSIGLLGSTGTYAYLNRAERRRAVEAAVAELGGAVPLLVGIGALRTDDAVRHGQDAKAAGADAVLLAPVSYTPLTEAEVFEHFATVARAVDLPVVIYNNPGTTHFTFSNELIVRLSQVPGVVAVKNPAPDAAAVKAELAALRAGVKPGFSIGYSGDWKATEALLAGGEAWYSVVGGLFPAPLMQLVRAARAGDAAEARRLNAALQPLWDLFIAHSSLRVVYAAANLLGLTDAAPPRPILPLDEPVKRQVAEVMRALGLR
ncbi:dihydrodipicolinate synthase family protein [Roseomonas aerophila]|uniref:Dihydrodipicolinate synthase family protein n=2 Tax=Teichococcus aerophilus TaxID=1224513 RepID=A0ABR7RP61_9PROT|nr:dihydrodipicolinate synthase family protein [Pseudoroseomonas aerophila]